VEIDLRKRDFEGGDILRFEKKKHATEENCPKNAFSKTIKLCLR
jgi:hypothetical protein